MSPKMGQKLTDNPKNTIVKARMDKETLKKLNYLVSEQNSDMSKVIRQGIDMVYNFKKGDGIMNEIETDTHKFVVEIDNKNTSDMRSVMVEYKKLGYKQVVDLEYGGNVILVYAKQK